MSNQRLRVFALVGIAIALVVLMVMQGIGLFYQLQELPSFFLLLGQFMMVKLVGDMIYYRLRPQYKDYGLVMDYVGNDFITFLRFAFPGAIVQRMAEHYFLNPFNMGPWLSELFLGPWIPVAVYLWNRFLRELAYDQRHTPGEKLIDLP